MKYFKPYIFIFIGFSFCLNNIKAQIFEKVKIDFKGADGGSANWCDYNNDSILDLFVTGYNLGGNDLDNAIFYQGINDSLFTESNISNITRVIYSQQAMGDYDNDGDIDLLLCGTTSGSFDENQTDLYENINGLTFEKTNNIFEKVTNGHVEWVDYDNDGDLDLFLMGYKNYDEFKRLLYINNGNKSFSLSNIYLEPIMLYNSKGAKWDDFNNDGFKDYFNNGIIYKNNGDNTFALIKNVNIPFNDYRAIKTGDYNNDGLLDILVWVYKNSTPSAMPVILFKNTGNFKFKEVWSQSIVHFEGSIDLVDLNYDGLSDIFVYCENEGPTKLFINKNNDTFTENNILNLPMTLWDASAYLGDYDNDLDLDVLIIGSKTTSASDGFTELYKNVDTLKNTSPQPPDSIWVEYYNDYIIIKWNEGSDNETPVKGLSYNLSVGTTLNGCEILSNQSNLNGSKQLIDLGNTKNNFYILKGLPKGNFYCSVQTIDNSYCSSKQSNNLLFQITSIKNLNTTIDYKLYPNPSNGIIKLEANNSSGKTQIILYNIFGQIIFETINYNNFNETINISMYPKGIYLLYLINNIDSKIIKILKE